MEIKRAEHWIGVKCNTALFLESPLCACLSHVCLLFILLRDLQVRERRWKYNESRERERCKWGLAELTIWRFGSRRNSHRNHGHHHCVMRDKSHFFQKVTHSKWIWHLRWICDEFYSARIWVSQSSLCGESKQEQLLMQYNDWVTFSRWHALKLIFLEPEIICFPAAEKKRRCWKGQFAPHLHGW